MDEITLPEKIFNAILIIVFIVLIAAIVIAVLTLFGPTMSNDSGEIFRSI